MEKTCIICGKQFTPVLRHSGIQLTCGPECRKIYNDERSKIRRQNPEFLAKKHQGYYDTHVIQCLICGKPVNRVFLEGRLIAKPRLHDECVYTDCRNSLLCGRRLNPVQQQRLAAKGYGVKDFVVECKAWRDKHMPMSACFSNMLRYIPQQFWLASDRVDYNIETQQYEVDLRTDYRNGKFKLKYLKFDTLQEMQKYFRDVRTVQKISSNFQK